MNDKPNGNPNIEDDLSLEAILAEYKSDAYITGQKKVPREDLDQQAQQIIEETLQVLPAQSPEAPAVTPSRIRDVPAAEPTMPLPKLERLKDTDFPVAEPTIQLPKIKDVVSEMPAPPIEAAEATMPLPTVSPVELDRHRVTTPPTAQVMPEQVVESVLRQNPEPGQAGYARSDSELSQSAYTDDTEHAYADRAIVEAFAARLGEVEDQLEKHEYDEDEEGFFSRLFRGRKHKTDSERYDTEDPEAFEYEGDYDYEDLSLDGLSSLQAAGKYGRGISGYQLRGVGAIVLALFMLLFTGLGDSGSDLFWIMSTFRGLTATLLVLQLLAMLLTAEVITTGLLDIFRRRPGVETLVTVAALASIADAIRILQAGGAERNLPYAAVVAAALGMALLGIKSVRNAMKITLRAAATGSNPYVVTSKLEEGKERFILFKSRGEVEGFVRKTEQIDFSEYIYAMAAPLLLVMSAVFALLAAIGGAGELWDMLPYFAAMTVVSASFTGLLAYGVPYAMLARKLAKVGAALAGWGGATEVAKAGGVVITDQDVFPRGTMSLGGVKILSDEGAEYRRVIAAAGSLIIASGSGLSDTFADILHKEKIGLLPVESLTSYEGGGIGATVGTEEVIVGSAGLMNLLGIRLPQDLNLKNAVFVAVGGELAGIFAINYAPQNSVMHALVILLRTKIKPLFAIRDFNITPMMLQNKFNISTEKINFLTYEERYALSDLKPDERAKPFAVLHREGLRPLVDVIVGGKRLRRAVICNTIFSVAWSVIGLIMLLSFFWTGAAGTVNAANLFGYMAASLVVMCITSRSAKSD